MDMGLDGRVALVTGGGGALGSVTAAMLAGEGARIAVADLDRDKAERVAAALRAAGREAAGFAMDVTDRPSVETAVEEVEAALGPIDILINNAGFSRDKYLTRMAETDWDVVHGVVMKGAFHCARAVLPGMQARGWGRIVNISSMAATGNAGQTNYASAKAGLLGFTYSLARESGRFNITVNAVAPGLIATERLRARPDYDKLEARARSLTPMPRLGVPEDVAKAVLFYCSSMGDWITAQCMNVTGGR